MENATKALLIAGGILIAIILLSIGVYLYVIYSNQAKTYNDVASTTEIQKFNNKFEVYIGRNDITPHEIATVINLSKKYNNIVEVYINNSKSFSYSTPENFIKDNSYTYSYKKVTYDENGRITAIYFSY